MRTKRVSVPVFFCLAVLFAFIAIGCGARNKDDSVSFVNGFESVNILENSISLLKPIGWKDINAGTQQIYVHPDMENKDDRALFIVTNYELVKDKETVLQAKVYEKGMNATTWVNKIKESLDKLPGMPQYEIIRNKEISKKAVMVKITDSSSKRLQYGIFQVVDEVPIAVEADAYGKFADENYIKESGILTDLIRMSRSVKTLKN
jgi:copper chaperone CopZ